MNFIRKEQLLQDLLLVDGVGRSGKVMLAEILTCLDRVQKQEYHEFLEYIPLAYKYGKIEKDMAISILRTQMDTELYNGMIGRKVNTRPTDYTSIYKYHSPEVYLERQVMMDGPVVSERVINESPIYMCWCHDLIQKSEIIFDAFEDKVKVVYINRRPIDIIYEWNVKGFGDRVGLDPTEMQYLLDFNGKAVPEQAIGWESEYLEMNPFERVVKMIHTSFKRNYEALMQSDKNSVMIVNFESLVTEPESTVAQLSNFLNSKPKAMMKNILERENCPRVLEEEVFSNRRNEIMNLISEDSLNYLEELDFYYLEISKLSES